MIDISERLEVSALLAQVAARTREGLARVEVVDEIDSTNSALLRERTPDHGLAVLFAERQSGGRGRLGRTWVSPPGGNLYVSLARRFEGGLPRLGGLSLVAGVAVAEALRTLGADSLHVKWPNDLVTVDGPRLRKLGGVLIEGGLQDGVARAVIGLGLNVRMPRDTATTIDQPWTDLHALLDPHTTDDLPSRTTVAACLLDALHDALALFDHAGLAPFVDRFAALDVLLGHTVDTVHEGVPLQGIAEGLDADGALRLRTPTGLHTLRAGEVSVRLST